MDNNPKLSRSAKWVERILISIAAIIVLLVIGIVLFIYSQGHCEPANRAVCASNLSQLYKGMYAYVAAYGRMENYPPHVGNQILFCLAGKCNDKSRHSDKYIKNTIFKDNDDLYECPSAKPQKGTISYLGPQKHTPDGNPSALAEGLPPDTPIAADKKGNHKDGGNVLFFNGCQ